MPPWFHFRTPPRPLEDHPAVSVIEHRLDAASRLLEGDSFSGDDLRPVAEHALWICACVAWDDAPTWLLWDTAPGGFMWRRVPAGTEPSDLVHASYTACGHADPAVVLRWLQGDVPDPWGALGSGYEDPGVLEALRRRINME